MDPESTRTGSPTSSRLLLVDDHPVLRAGVAALLSAEPDLSIVAEAATGREAIELACSLRPDLVVMDVGLPDLNGAEATRQIRARCEMPILALSVHEEVSFVRMLLEAGAGGYVLKRSACDELVRAVRIVVGGGTYIDPAVAGLLLRSGQRRNSLIKMQATIALSDRESDVVRLLARGLTMKEMAVQLALSPRTLETYRARALEKLGFTTRAELVRYAVSCGWLSDGK